MEYRASVRSAGPIHRKTERTMTDLQKAKEWAESQMNSVDDVVEVIGVSYEPSMELIDKVWRLVDGQWMDTFMEQN